MIDLETMMSVGTAAVGGLILALAAYRIKQFCVGFWEGLHGIEAQELRGFEVMPMNGGSPVQVERPVDG